MHERTNDSADGFHGYSESSMDSKAPLPTAADEVTATWLTQIIGTHVKDASVVDVVHGTSSKIFVRLEHESDSNREAPGRLCVKGGFNPMVREAFPEMWATYRREAEFYFHIAPTVGMRLPRVWYSGTDVVNGQGVVVMSDLTTEDCRFGNVLEPWSLGLVRLGIKQLALLHGKTWGRKPSEYPWLARDKMAENPMHVMLRRILEPETWNWCLAGDRPRPVHATLRDRERILAAYEKLWNMTEANEDLQCLVHGDCHIGNTFITPDDQPGFLDWQIFHHGSPMHDVAYFLIGAMAPEARRQSEIGLVEEYLDELHGAGGPRLKREDIWNEYRKHALHGFLWALTPMDMQPEPVVCAIVDRYSTAIIDHKSLDLIEGNAT